MFAYKGFHSNLICRDYQFHMGKNVTSQANCAQNGFHCAEDPLDCLTYYPDTKHSIYCIVKPGGDIDEDAVDSRIACTELTIIKQLSMEEFFLHALAYMVDHPFRSWSNPVQKENGAAQRGYAVVRGSDPIASGKKGDILAFAKEDPSGKIVQIAVVRVDGKQIKSNVWYDIDGQRRTCHSHE